MTNPSLEQPVVRPVIRRKVLGDQLLARLESLPGRPAIAAYRGEVPTEVPLLHTAAGGLDPSRRIAPYAVLFDGTGADGLEPGLADCGEDLRWTPQVTVAAAWSDDCVDAVDRVLAWLHTWRPVLPKASCGRLQTPPGFDPGQPRKDPTVTPPRWFVPLQFRLDATT